MILTYHNIGTGNDKTWVSIDAFRKQIEELRKAEFQIVEFEKYDPYNSKHIVLTFDDGRTNILDILPILKDNKYPFYVFVVGENIGKSEEFLCEEDFGKIKAAGGFFGVVY